LIDASTAARVVHAHLSALRQFDLKFVMDRVSEVPKEIFRHFEMPAASHQWKNFSYVAIDTFFFDGNGFVETIRCLLVGNGGHVCIRHVVGCGGHGVGVARARIGDLHIGCIAGTARRTTRQC
jgi:hypothetical protein